MIPSGDYRSSPCDRRSRQLLLLNAAIGELRGVVLDLKRQEKCRRTLRYQTAELVDCPPSFSSETICYKARLSQQKSERAFSCTLPDTRVRVHLPTKPCMLAYKRKQQIVGKSEHGMRRGRRRRPFTDLHDRRRQRPPARCAGGREWRRRGSRSFFRRARKSADSVPAAGPRKSDRRDRSHWLGRE